MNAEPAAVAAIETMGLTRRFGRTLAVDNLNLTVRAGSVFGFIGPNGAGKSTTIRMLIGVLSPTAGRARLLGQDVGPRAEGLKHRVGYVPELHFMYRWMRASEVIAFCRTFYPTWNDQFCGELLDIFELDPRRRIKQLSKGMVAKLALLLAVAHEPELLILDEPTSGLDPLMREEFLDGVLRTICARQRTVLFSSHTLSDVQRLADEVGIICNGRLLAHCPTDELLTDTKRIRAVLRDGCRPGAPPAGTIWQRVANREWLLTVRGFTPALVDALRADAAVASVEVVDVGLEDVFKDMVRGQKVPA
ncbi:MAG TPA: ABC transporter ATP-binding protein [Phycisphaerae bacterium]|nr:ABC transporter ATP-binding protein [Phycisphaerae bacterium]